MKKLLLMLACVVGLACYSVGGNEPTAAVTSDQTVQTVSAVAAEPAIDLVLDTTGWYLRVAGNDRPITVVVDGPGIPAMRWQVPAHGTYMFVYGPEAPILLIAEWDWGW